MSATRFPPRSSRAFSPRPSERLRRRWFILAGIGIGCVETAEHAAVAAHAPADIRGSAFGLLAAVQSFGNFAASLIAGILWTSVGPSWAFAYLAGWMALAAILLTASVRRPLAGQRRSLIGGSEPTQK
jgi:MFS family permease